MLENELGKGSREIQVIVGRGGNGKTTMLRKILAKTDRALVFDPLKVMYPGLILESRSGLESWLDCRMDNQRFRLIYRPQVDESDSEGMAAESDYLCWIGRNIGNLDLFFDEVDSFSDAKAAPPQLKALLNFGRRHNVSIRGAVRRPQVKIPRDWITEATRFTIFRTCDPGDAVFLQRYTGIEYERILDLRPFEYWEWVEGAISRHKMTNPYLRG